MDMLDGHIIEHMEDKNKKGYANISVKKLKKSEVEIEGEITAERMAAARAGALKRMGAEAVIPGFRKGKVPENILIEKYGEMAILEETAEVALGEEYPNIIIDNKLDVVGRPEISVTKIAPGNPLGFKIKTAVMPELKLPDYKEIAKTKLSEEKEPEPATNKEVEEVENQIRRIKRDSAKRAAGTAETSVPAEGEKKEDEPLPELDDEFIKSVGKFESVADFRAKVRENITNDKKAKARDKRRLTIIEAVAEKTEGEIPDTIVNGELERMLARFRGDIEQAGLKYEDYLGKIKKTEEDFRKEWRTDAEKRAKVQLILNEIAKAEKLEPAKEKIEHETKHIMEHMKDADPDRARAYVDMMLTNEMVLEFLESQK